MMNTVMFSSKSDNWETPQSFFDQLNREFGFTLDVCADENNRKCEKFYTKEQDSLTLSWETNGAVWCNPPYGRQIGMFVKKAFDESKKHRQTVVMLIPARTDTRWFHEYILGKAKIRFIRGRLKFGCSKNSAPFPSMVVIFTGEEE